MAESALAKQPLAPEPAFEQQTDDTEWERENEVAAGDFDLQDQKRDRQQAKGERTRVHHLAILGRPDSDHAGVSGVERAEGENPGGDDQGRYRPVVGVDCSWRHGDSTAESEGERAADRDHDDADIGELQPCSIAPRPDETCRHGVDGRQEDRRRCRLRGDQPQRGGFVARRGHVTAMLGL